MDWLKSLLVWCFVRVGLCLVIDETSSDHEWDHIIFTQHWPASVCAEWKSKGSGHTCSLPSKNVWTIHGLWPAKTGSKGPTFCKSSVPFDEDALDPIIESLQDNWTNIDMPSSPYSFWHYEWRKHGTCALSLPKLDSEIKYFSQGLEWIEKYNMEPALASSGFVEGNSYSANDIWAAVKAHFGKIPTLHCFEDAATKQSYLFEIRVCFDKNLTLIDCPENEGSKYIANCPLTLIEYPIAKAVDRLQTPKSTWLLDTLNIVRWLQWLTH